MTSNIRMAANSYIGARFGIVSIYRLVNVAQKFSATDLSCMIFSAHHEPGAR